MTYIPPQSHSFQGSYSRSSSGSNLQYRRRIQPSHLLTHPVEKPWLEKPDPWQRVSWWITVGCASIGIIGSALLCYFSYKAVPDIGKLCLVLEDNFDTLDTSIWQHEVQTDGFGNGEFEWTTTDADNSFVENGVLYIVPTLTESVVGPNAIFDGYNGTAPGCTAVNSTTGCILFSNSTSHAVLPPVRSARLNTKRSHNIQFGRVEIRARLPRGDWLWPALWMLPVNDTYGTWPASGEIDIMESRGNDPSYPHDPRNYVSSSLNWGPTTELNRWWRTRGYSTERHNSYDKDFHTYVLEWSQEFLWVYVDSRITRTVDLRFDQTFFQRGDFPKTIMNGSEEIVLKNPWEGASQAAPFDQPFYLIMDVAVGGTSGWFPDGLGNKPWLDQSTNARRDFALAKDKWYATWPDDPKQRALAVDYVKMWQKCQTG